MKSLKKIALIEFGGSHAECLLSQFLALKNHDCHITFIGTKKLWEQNPSLHPFADVVHLIQFEGKAIGDFKKAMQLNAYLKKQGIQKAIFNTAQGGHVRNMCLFAPKSVEFIGIIHTLKKFQGSFTQKLINIKIKKYFVLNDYFKNLLKNDKKLKIESFYPLDYPRFDKRIEKNIDEKWISIIGGVENRRKDLMGSIELMKQFPINFKFLFLGKSDTSKNEVQAFLKEIENEGLTHQVKIFTNFIVEQDFDAYLKNTDFIWPMVHPNTPSADEYFKNQISGAINVAFSYKIPLLIHENYCSTWEDLSSSICYQTSDFKKCIENIALNHDEYKQKLIKNRNFDPKFQAEKFIQLVYKHN